MTGRPRMATGYSWSCTCGWATPRNQDFAEVEHKRYGHLTWHQHHDQQAAS